MFGLDGAGMIVRRAALESIRFRDEYLDENFVTHKEDHDVSWRLRLAGWHAGTFRAGSPIMRARRVDWRPRRIARPFVAFTRTN